MKADELSPRQLANAGLIFEAALPYGVESAQAALMAAGAESSWLRYANNGLTTRDDVPMQWRILAATSMQWPYDAVAGEAWTTADSVGLFQQRAMYGYGTIAELMDPGESTRIFVRGSSGGKGTTRYFLQSPADLTLAQRVQWTQGSEFPTGENYAPFEDVAAELVTRFGGTIQSTEKDWSDMATREEFVSALKEVVGARLDRLETTLVAEIQARIAEKPDNARIDRLETTLVQEVQARTAEVSAKVDALRP